MLGWNNIIQIFLHMMPNIMTCYSHFISERNIIAAHQQTSHPISHDTPSSKHEEAIKPVIEYINNNVLSKKANVVTTQLIAISNEALHKAGQDEQN